MSKAGKVLLKNSYEAEKEELIELVSKYQSRNFSDEIDFLENMGGDRKFQDLLGVDFIKGINTSEVQNRREQYGTAHMKKIGYKRFPFEDLSWSIKGFLIASIISIVINFGAEESHQREALIEAFVIFIAVMSYIVWAVYNHYRNEKQLKMLHSFSRDTRQVLVLRDGELKRISQTELVVGDIVKINEGMEIPAEMLLLEAHGITIDESAMTGEIDPARKRIYAECIEKRDQIIASGQKNSSRPTDVYSPILISHTRVLTGEGKALVFWIDQNPLEVQLNQASETEASPLKEKLEELSKGFDKFGLIVAILIFLALTIRFIANEGFTNGLSDCARLARFVIVAITVSIVAVPSGLSLSVIYSCSFAIKRMMMDNCLVRKVQAIEPMGAVDTICCEKTGVLTQNKHSVTSFWNEKHIEFFDPYGRGALSDHFNNKFQNLLIEAIACNSGADLEQNSGSLTDLAMLGFLRDMGQDYKVYKTRHLTSNSVIFPFTSMRKRSSAILENIENGLPSKKRMHMKGANEIILEDCSHFYSLEEDKIVPMTATLKERIEKEIENMAEKALRIVYFAYKEINGDEDLETKEHDIYQIERNNFILLGVLGIRDILRFGIKDAVTRCKRAGIKVRMITGDNLVTAKTIATESGIFGPNSKALTGPEFTQLIGGLVCKNCRTRFCDCPTDKETAIKKHKPIRVDTIENTEAFDQIYQNLDILARARPEDKYAFVVGLKERNCVVAVTGEGTSDAPALKKADVGISLGTGTEIAKEASDIILLDNNFASTVGAIMWGRNVYNSMKMILQFELTINIVAAIFTLIAAAILKEAVLSAVQLLWVNLITSILAPLALATELPNQSLLDESPFSRYDSILSRSLKKHIIGQAVYQIVVLIILAFSAPDEGYERSGVDIGPSRHCTLIFNTFMLCQVFNLLNCRKIRDELNIFNGVQRNKYFMIALASVFILQIILGNYGGLVLNVATNGLNVGQWFIAILIASGGLLWSTVLRLIKI